MHTKDTKVSTDASYASRSSLVACSLTLVYRQELQSYLGNVLNETLALRSFEVTLHGGIDTELERRDRLEQLKAERLTRGNDGLVWVLVVISRFLFGFILHSPKVSRPFSCFLCFIFDSLLATPDGFTRYPGLLIVISLISFEKKPIY